MPSPPKGGRGAAIFSIKDLPPPSGMSNFPAHMPGAMGNHKYLRRELIAGKMGGDYRDFYHGCFDGKIIFRPMSC
ncbi:hypothetical protein CEXT_707901 [Caerostris extrusa]|uniref:Uncharacterized protein n=1 Tax=Caerostris extrusa TaxID=172846 RepID=A0AAV4TSY7_CAEEX|nr:hypothetical protein CEXT_707901 [Caerostris extrusa]